MSHDQQTWSSRRGFILATIGSAIGIGSIWKFPYEVGANGGGSFVIVYLIGLAIVVIPLMLAELAIGRRGGGNAVASIAAVARAGGHSPLWRAIGGLGALAAFLILSYYSVIGGWTLISAWTTAIDGLPADGAAASVRFADLRGSGVTQAGAQAAFLIIVAVVVSRGVQRGIEKSMTMLMPVLFVMLVALAILSSVVGDFTAALEFLFVPKSISARAVLEALGLGFFSIGVGLGLMMTYAAHAADDMDLSQVTVVSVGADTFISLIAGLAVFPIVFAHGLNPASGPGLAFETLPIAFNDVPLGRIVAVGFYLLLFVAALGSSMAMLEGFATVTAGMFGWSQRRSVVLGTTACFVVGLATVFSFGRWSQDRPLGFIDRYRQATVYDILDDVTSNLLLPLGDLLIAVFAGWVASSAVLTNELRLGPRSSQLLRLSLRYVAPLVIVAVTVAAW